jgi:hypothetical protein
MPPRSLFFLLAAIAAMLPPVAARAGEQIFRHDYPQHSDTFVEIQSVFGGVAKQGSLPYRITIRNNSGRTRVWTVRLSEGNYGRRLNTAATFSIEVEDGAQAVREVTLPFAPAFLAYDYRNLEITVSAPGLPTETRTFGEQTPQSFPMLAMSKALAQRSLSRLDDLVKNENSGNPHFAKPFDPAQLPSDWLGYTGLDGLILDEPAWKALTSAQRQALVAWIRLGGRLDLYGGKEIDPASLDLPLSDAGGKDLGWSLSLGSIHFHSWDGREVPENHLAFFRKIPQGSESLDKDYDLKWKLFADFGTKEFNPLLVFLLLLVFAILVAPVNLFYLAKPGRRHRLFITTPIISVSTCLLIVLIIFFIDGIGGNGQRVVLADLQPGENENRLYVTQEQLSRTGVMVNPGFDPGRIYDLNPVNLPASQFNPFSQHGERTATYVMTAGRYSGEFFRSRSEQAFSIRTAEPGRARIDDQGEEDGKPVLVSNLAQEILDFHYRDAKGGLWVTPAGSVVGPGQRIPLEKSDQARWPDWIEDSISRFSVTRQNRIRGLTDPHRFFARVRDPEALALPTHRGIRWQETHLLLTGTPAGAAPASSEPTQPGAAQ